MNLRPPSATSPAATVCPLHGLRRCAPRKSWVALAASLVAAGALAAPSQDPISFSLEELMSMEISSAAKKVQRLADAATAIHVLNHEDIRRSGATNLPELLRLVPGVQVARIDGSRYAVSIRGFGNRYSGKLLVLQDGRTLYSPLFSGTYWEAQDVVLEDIERIEVIRGPGGTLWGANAMNGVINILTRHAKESQGTFVEATAGSLENGLTVRHGTALGDNGHLRAYAKLMDHGALDTDAGQDAHDAWRQERAGFRADWALDARDTVTVQGDVYRNKAQQSVLATSLVPPTTAFLPDTARLSGANLLFRWQRAVGADEDWHVQGYLDHTEVRDVLHQQRVSTADVEWQHRFRLSPRQEITWGAGVRSVQDAMDGSFTVSLVPHRNSNTLYSAFLQDEISLRDDLRLTVGSKLEHNDVTGLEVQPSARLLWKASPTDSVWASVSRAVQTPSRALRDVEMNLAVLPGLPGLPGPVVIGVRGNDNVVSEEMVAREIGYRSQLSPDVNVDVTAFYNTYDNLVTLEQNPLAFMPVPLLARRFDNLMTGKTYGVELAGNWQVAPNWRLKGSYSWLQMKLTPKAGGSGELAFGGEGSKARQVVQLHSLHNLSHNLELDANLYVVDKLPALGPASASSVKAYARLDLRMGWKPSPGLELSLTARNVLSKRHAEFVGDDVTASSIPRSVLAQLRWTY